MERQTLIVLETFRAVEERDLEGLLACYHDDVEFNNAESLPYGGMIRGKERIRARLEHEPERSWIGTWGPLQPTREERRMDPRVLATNRCEVVIAYRQRAVSPAGERLDSPVIGLYEVRDDKLARAQMFHYDTAAIVAFLQRAGAGLGASSGS